MFPLFFGIAILATTLGSMVGLGGGVIIKPLLDSTHLLDLKSISLLSSVTIFSMALVSLYKQSKKGFKISSSLILLSFGGVLGGWLGSLLFGYFLDFFPQENIPKAIQSGILAFLLFIVLFKGKIPKVKIDSKFFALLIGVFLGTIASFLGIGGGPLNILILMVFLGVDIKEAAISSIFIIFFSQGCKIAFLLLSKDLSTYNLTPLFLMIPGGILGGLIGSKLHIKFTHSVLDIFFNISLALLIFLNLFNCFSFL